MVLRGEDANLLSVGAVDFGIIVDSAVILVENIFRNFQSRRQSSRVCCSNWRRAVGRRSDTHPPARRHAPHWTDRLRLILISALQVDNAIFFSAADHGGGVRAVVHHAGGRGPDFQSRWRGPTATRSSARCWRRSPSRRCLASFLLPEHVEETETIVVRALRWVYTPVLRWSLRHRKIMVAIGRCLSVVVGLSGVAARQRVPAGAGRRQSVDSRVNAADDRDWRPANRRQPRCAKFCFVIPKSLPLCLSMAGRTTAATPSPFSNVELFVPLKPFDEWPTGFTKDKLIDAICRGNLTTSCRASTSISRSTSRTTSRRRCRASKAPTR